MPAEAMRKPHALARLNRRDGSAIDKEDQARSHGIKEELMTRGVECWGLLSAEDEAVALQSLCS